MNDLTLPPGTALATTASNECSPGLWRQLTDHSQSWAEAIERLSGDERIRGELQIVAPLLAKHAEPCGPRTIIAALTPMVTLYGVSDKSQAEWSVFWGFYITALGDLPAEAVQRGVDEYVADAKSEFFPKPGPLKAICEKHAVPLRMAANRARKALEKAQ